MGARERPATIEAFGASAPSVLTVMTDLPHNDSRLLDELWEQAVDGDRARLDQLIELIYDDIVRWVRHKRGSRSIDTFEGAHEVVLNLIQGIEAARLEQKDQVRAYVRAVVENTLHSIDRYRKRAKRDERRRADLGGESGELELADPGQQRPEIAASAEEAKARREALLEQALPQLDDESREILERRQAGEAFATIGAHFGLSEDAVRMRHKRCVLRLRSIMRRLESGHTTDLFGAHD